MPWLDVAEQNPWASSEDEGDSTSSESPVLASSGPVVVNTAPTIKKEPHSVVVLEIPSSSPSPILEGEDNDGQDAIPELLGTHLPAPIAVPDSRATSCRPTALAGPFVVNGEKGPFKEESHHGIPSTAPTPVDNRSESVVVVPKTKRHSSSESLSPALTEDDCIDDEDDEDDEDGTEPKGRLHDPPCFACFSRGPLRGKADSLCYHPAIFRANRTACVGCHGDGKRCKSAPKLVVQAWKAWRAERTATVAAERALKVLRTTCNACRNLRQLVKMGMVP